MHTITLLLLRHLYMPQFFNFSFNGSADSIFSILRIKIKVYFSFCIFKFAADSKYLTIQKKKSSRALKIFRSCRQNRLKSGMSDVYAHCVGHCDRKTSIAKLRFRNSDPDKMFRSLPQLNVWARTRNEAGVSNVCMTQILCFGPSKQNSHTKKVLQDRAFIQNRSTGACLTTIQVQSWCKLSP